MAVALSKFSNWHYAFIGTLRKLKKGKIKNNISIVSGTDLVVLRGPSTVLGIVQLNAGEMPYLQVLSLWSSSVFGG